MTITRLPAVSTTAFENASPSRTRATKVWIERPVSVPIVNQSSVLRQAVVG
jgi:hypothetical protein